MVLPRQGLYGQSMGGFQAQQPVFGKDAIWPAVIVVAASSSGQSDSFAQQAAQTHPEPAVEALEDPRWAAVLEVREPATKRLVDIVDDEHQ